MIEEAEVDLAAATERVNGILSEDPAAGRPPRKRRSDADKPRPPKPAPAAEGRLTQAQVERIHVFMAQIQEARNALDDAHDAHDKIRNEFADYLDSLTQPGPK